MSNVDSGQTPSLKKVSYSIKDFLEKFSLPQLVSIQKGYYDDYQCKSIAPGTVYNFKMLESIETVLFESADGNESRIPLNCPFTIERVVEERFQQELSVQDLAGDKRLNVKFVRVIQGDPNFEPLIKTGEKLRLEPRSKKHHNSYLTVKKASASGKIEWKIPGSCQAKFLGLWDGRETLLSKFVNKTKLPVYVRFVPSSADDKKEEETGIERTYIGPVPDGIVKLKGILVDSFVSATTKVEGVILIHTFPKTLSITVAPFDIDSMRSRGIESQGKDHQSEVYEDMSGFQVGTLKLPTTKEYLLRSRRTGATNNTVAQMVVVGQEERQGNTYSPPPMYKATRSKSTPNASKGKYLLQKATSNWELRSSKIENEENVYETLDFCSLPSTGISKSSSLSQIERTLKRDISTDKMSPHIEVKNRNRMHRAELEKTSVEKNRNDTPGSICLDIRRSCLTCDKPPVKMKTFGWKDNSASENENVPDMCEPKLTRKSFSLNRLTTTSCVQETSSPFYGPGDQDEEAAQAFTQLALFTVPQVQRSSSDQLAAQILRRPETCGQGKTVVPGVKGTIDPVKPRKSGNSKNQKADEKTLCKKISKAVESLNQSKTQKSNAKRDCPAEEATRHSVLPENIFSEYNVAGGSDRKPVSLPRKYSASLHGQEQREDRTLATLLENSTLVSSSEENFGTIQRSEDANDEQPVGEQREEIPQVLAGNKTSPGTQTSMPDRFNKTNSKTTEFKFIIPKDLSTLSVDDVSKCLQALNMQQFEEIFKERQVDGCMLLCLDDDALQSFDMDRFHRLKILRVIAGWRPHL